MTHFFLDVGLFLILNFFPRPDWAKAASEVAFFALPGVPSDISSYTHAEKGNQLYIFELDVKLVRFRWPSQLQR